MVEYSTKMNMILRIESEQDSAVFMGSVRLHMLMV